MGRSADKTGTVRMQKVLVTVSVLLFALKVLAWYLTASVSILTDALESTVNVVAGLIGLYSMILSSKPKDRDHPYGHGKVEFISAAVEGLLISVAGLLILYEALNNLVHPHTLKALDSGLILLALSALVNYITGYFCIQKGKKENSPQLVASGQHLQTDTWSTIGILLGIVLIMLTGLAWIDSAAAMLFALFILYTGYRIIRRSVSGIMDESDSIVIGEIVALLREHRKEEWIDVHNMRVINYAGFYHIDCHLTVPFYINVHEAHRILDSLTDLIREHFRDRVEFFVHVDGCLPPQCRLCSLKECKERTSPFQALEPWTYDNIILNSKHGLSSGSAE